ncbi:MAG: hypothetical protein IPM52_13430 [Bacteroidetes bacterium]|nr:hypothetical protein [Bacteroidota bacterium]
MRLRSLVLFATVLALLAMLVFVLLFRKTEKISLWEAMPDKAVGVFHTPSGSSFAARLAETSWWASLRKAEYFSRLSDDLALLDTLLVQAGLKQEVQHTEAAFVLLELQNTYQFVFYARPGRNFAYWNLHEKALPAFGNRFELIKRKTSRYQTFVLIDRQSRRQMNYGFVRGLAIASFSREAFEAALIALESPPEKQFLELAQKQRNASSDAVLYVRPPLLAGPLEGLFAAAYGKQIGASARLLGPWLALDVHLRQHEIFLSGLLTGTGINELVYSGQHILPDSLAQWLPVGTMSFVASYAGSPLSRIRISGKLAGSGSDGHFLLFVPQSPEAVLSEIFSALPMVPSPWNSAWSAPVRADINQMGLQGSGFTAHNQPYFVTTNGRIFLFSGNLMLLRNYLENKQKEITDFSWRAVAGSISQRSDMVLYHQVSKTAGSLSDIVDGQLKFRLMRDAAALHGFESISVQLSKTGSEVYASVLIRGNEIPMGQLIPEWSARLNAPGASAPFIFNAAGQSRVIVFDSAGWMYGFSPEGNELWKRPIGGLTLMQPLVVSMPGGKHPMMLFNTTGRIFLTDPKGNQAPGFPVQLPSVATSALGYDSTAGPMFFVNCADRRTYGFNFSGKALSSWEPPLASDISNSPPLVVSAGNQSFVLVHSIDGRLKILDDNGLERIRLREDPDKAAGADYHLNRTNARGVFLTATSKGEIVYIGSAGLSRSPALRSLSPTFYFHYDDFDGDRTPDFIFADGKEVAVFDRFNRIVFEGRLAFEPDRKPLYIRRNSGGGVWCFQHPAAGQAAIVSAGTGTLNFEGLPKGQSYGFGYADPDGPLLLGAYNGNKLTLYRVN